MEHRQLNPDDRVHLCASLMDSLREPPSIFPVDKLDGSLDALYSAFGSLIASFSADDRDKLFYANAARVYRL